MNRSRFATRRACDVNYGDRERVRGAELRAVAWISVAQSQAHTVYVSADVEAPAALVDRVHAVARIEWGHGGASVTEDFPVAGRLRVPLVGSMVRVSMLLVDTTGVKVADSVSADCAVVIAPGHDGETTRNTRWLRTHGAGGVLSERPEHVVAICGYNTTVASRWVMLFDTRTAAVPGASPVLSRPATTAPFDVRDEDGRPFYVGVAWGVSQDPLVFVPDGAADVHLEAGFLL